MDRRLSGSVQDWDAVELRGDSLGNRFGTVEVRRRLKRACCACFNDMGWNTCQRCISHSWFFFLCFGYVFISSIPRILVLADLFTSILMYLLALPSPHQPIGRFLTDDIYFFNYTSSAIDILALTVTRCVILFFCFAYRNQTCNASIQTSTLISSLSFTVLCFKLGFAHHSLYSFLITSMLFTVIELGSFLLIRRRRIRMPETPAPQSYYRLERQHRESAEGIETKISMCEQEPIDLLRHPSSAFFEFEGLQIHYVFIKHPKSTRTVVLFHGFGGGLFSWFNAMEHLMHEQVSILLFDRPGFGLSSRPLRGEFHHSHFSSPYSVDFSASLSVHLLRYLNLESEDLVLVGHSTGAITALKVSQRIPKQVSNLILIAPSSGPPGFIRSIVKSSLVRSVVLQLIRTEIANFMLSRAWYDEDAVSPLTKERYQASLQVPNWGEALLEMAAVTHERIQDNATGIQCPVTIMWGSDDRLIPLAPDLTVFFIHSQTTVVANCGHLPHEECPRVFVDHLMRFIASPKYALDP